MSDPFPPQPTGPAGRAPHSSGDPAADTAADPAADTAADKAADTVLTGGELLTQSGTASAPGRRRGLVTLGAVVAVAAVAGAAAAAGMWLSGGGTQPEDLIPAGVVAYADLDLDPAAGQKANIARFLAHFEDLDSRLGAEDGWRSALLERLFDGSPQEAAEVKGWLGDRFGVALLGGSPVDFLAGGGPPVVAALQVTDGGAARAWLTDKLGGHGSVTVVDGYALVGAEGVDLDQVVADADAGSLADSAPFREAMDSLGDGVAQLYLDTEELQDLAGMGGFAGIGSAAGAGIVAYVVRVDPDAVEVVGTLPAGSGTPGSVPTTVAAGLPGSTAAMAAGSLVGPAMYDQWESMLEQAGAGSAGSFLRRELRQLERTTGLSFPEDLLTVFGNDLVIAVDGESLATAPQYGVRVVADAAESERLVQTLGPWIARETGGYGLALQPLQDGWLLASDADYAATLSAAEGGFLDLPKVQEALPDAEGAGMIAYLDVDAFDDLVRQSSPDAAATIEPLSALGVTSVGVDGRLQVRVRLTLD